MSELQKKDDESLATYIYRVVDKNYNEMNPKGFQNFLDQMIMLCQDMDQGKHPNHDKEDSVKE
tara:strand:+ start:109 stop:297 length:189 start_codon:yes stop_codon:yes gene_type:complete